MKLTNKEFSDLGLLQEINRNILHPAGFALGIEYPDDTETPSTDIRAYVLDERADAEGVVFGEGSPKTAKVDSVRGLIAAKAEARFKACGFVVQPAADAPKPEFVPMRPGDQPLNADDEGEIEYRCGVAPESQQVVIDFVKPVKWLGMSSEDAEHMASIFMKNAAVARGNTH